ncbi:alpha/beta fold hydrolase [Mangrovivirga sp. M17]|uniref:Alpha/beta fold hydrolase n=1 Tax=Mangrovivirga halotolerans TaxID=2993936 RepID=A0ABT3RLM5_9BACT|nr:alpha/beta fold hydrolase [Mangrovivirga halotolerans]MCX2742709.1 alpha/beta fold hydrolase [Mangrovivirga halotolerans]
MAKITTTIESNTPDKPILIDVCYESSHKPKPVIVFCHGFKGFKDWGGWRLMAEEFASLDLVSVNFNFSHNGTTPEDPMNFGDLEAFGQNNYGKELDDINRVIDWITNLPSEIPKEEIDPSKIAIMGHSRGGAMTLLAAIENPNINLAAALAPVYNPVDRMPTDNIEKWKKDGVVYIDNARTGQKMPLYYQFYEDTQLNKERYNLPERISKLNKPALIIHGSADPTVDYKGSVKLRELNDSIQLEIIEGADHVFGMSHPYPDKPLPAHMKSVMKNVVEFLSPLRLKK